MYLHHDIFLPLHIQILLSKQDTDETTNKELESLFSNGIFFITFFFFQIHMSFDKACLDFGFGANGNLIKQDRSFNNGTKKG